MNFHLLIGLQLALRVHLERVDVGPTVHWSEFLPCPIRFSDLPPYLAIPCNGSCDAIAPPRLRS